jgi:hypothetical protein
MVEVIGMTLFEHFVMACESEMHYITVGNESVKSYQMTEPVLPVT